MSMEKVHGLYDSDNVENGYEPPQATQRRTQKGPQEVALPKMIYETLIKMPETTSDILLLKRSSATPTASSTGSRCTGAVSGADKVASRRLIQGQSRGCGASVLGGAGGEKKVGQLKKKVMARDEGNYPGRSAREDPLQEEPQRKSSNFNEKVTMLKSVIDSDRKGVSAGMKKTNSKTDKLRLKKQQSQTGDKRSLNERRPTTKPVNVDILCGIDNKPESKILDSDVQGRGGDVDDELNHLLSQLEYDESFQKLSDNEKMSWLESLFYQDTKPKVHSIMRRVGDGQNRSKSPVKKTAADVMKTKNVTVINSITLHTPDIKPATSSADVTVNENLISLAQSYFTPAASNQSAIGTEKRDDKLIPVIEKKKNDLRQPAKCSSQCEGATPSETSHALSTDSRMTPAKSHQATSESTEPPPIPPRSVQPKTAMLRLMNSATNILKR